MLHRLRHGKIVTIHQINHLGDDINVFYGKEANPLIACRYGHKHRCANPTGNRVDGASDIVQFQNGVGTDIISLEKLPGQMPGIRIVLKHDKLAPAQMHPVNHRKGIPFRRLRQINQGIVLTHRQGKVGFLHREICVSHARLHIGHNRHVKLPSPKQIKLLAAGSGRGVDLHIRVSLTEDRKHRFHQIVEPSHGEAQTNPLLLRNTILLQLLSQLPIQPQNLVAHFHIFLPRFRQEELLALTNKQG